MSQFTEFASVRIPHKHQPLFELTEDLSYHRFYEDSGAVVTAPKGTLTNFASLPWIVQLFWKPYDVRWIKSSIIHDFLWSRAKTLRDYGEANRIFKESMIVEGTTRLIATLFYTAVSISKYVYWIRKLIKNTCF